MSIKNFDEWNSYKKQLEHEGVSAYFQVREVWWCSIGVNIGSEQDGHHERFERPVLVLKGFSTQLFWGVPISTKIKPRNPYYLSFMHDKQQYSAIISQLRLFDARRLTRKLYAMSQASFSDIQLRIIREIASAEIKTDPRVGSPRSPKAL